MPSVKSAQEIGADLINQAEEGEKRQVEAELKDLTDRWNSITQAADDRRNALETSLHLAKQFHDHMEPLLDWLDNTEKKLASLDTVGIDAETIKKQVTEQDQIASDVREHRDDLDHVLLSGQDLLKQSSGDDQTKVKDTMEGLKDRYEDLANRCDKRQQNLEEALPLAENVHATHEQLLDWLQHVEPELRGKEPVGPEAEDQVAVSRSFL